MSITLRINGNEVEAEMGSTILEAAQANEIYIPRLCYHPSLGSSHGLKPVDVIYREDFTSEHCDGGCSEGTGTGTSNCLHNDGSGPEEGFEGCRLCLVEVQGCDELVTACDTIIENGMVVNSESDQVKDSRRKNLSEILKDHPHACLQCAQQEGCSRTQCSSNVPENERCCPLLSHCELQKVSRYIGIKQDLQKYIPGDLPIHDNEPLFKRDYNLCISCLRCVRACRDLRGIETLGFVYNGGKTIVGAMKSTMYSESDCRFCGACVEVCPTGTLTDKDLPRGERDDVLLPCVSSCPAGLDIPGYIRLIAVGRFGEAELLIREKIPFPGILGRICFHPCEDVCRRGELNDPMAICDLKWFAADHADESFLPDPKPSTGKRIAVVGSGPSGLSAAYYLALAGHEITVIETEDEVGGMLRYAIPDYRLSPEYLDKELSIFRKLDVEFRTGTTVGIDTTLSALQKEYDAIFLGIGACVSKRIPVEGSELEGVEWGLDFLRAVKTKTVASLNGSVMVIGGGNVAMDVARSCIRLGADAVQLACLESNDEMPAHDWEVQEAREEGVLMYPSWGPKQIQGDEGKVQGIELVRCTSVFDDHGNFSPRFDEEEIRHIETEKVILAIGQSTDLTCIEDPDMLGEGNSINVLRGIISVDNSQETSIPGVYVGGEASRGPSSVVEAVADGVTAASAIDKYLGGDGNILPSMVEHVDPDPDIGVIEGFADLNREKAMKREACSRIESFDMVQLSYDEDQARREALRCLQCDLRLKILPVDMPPEMWMELNEENVAQVPSEEGVIRLLDEDKVVIVIKGTQDMHADLQEKLDSETNARYFEFEPDPMYTKRESELIQQYLQQFGKMPEGDGGDDDLDDLF